MKYSSKMHVSRSISVRGEYFGCRHAYFWSLIGWPSSLRTLGVRRHSLRAFGVGIDGWCHYVCLWRGICEEGETWFAFFVLLLEISLASDPTSFLAQVNYGTDFHLGTRHFIPLRMAMVWYHYWRTGCFRSSSGPHACIFVKIESEVPQSIMCFRHHK